jgi:hypothetical protein
LAAWVSFAAQPLKIKAKKASFETGGAAGKGGVWGKKTGSWGAGKKSVKNQCDYS